MTCGCHACLSVNQCLVLVSLSRRCTIDVGKKLGTHKILMQYNQLDTSLLLRKNFFSCMICLIYWDEDYYLLHESHLMNNHIIIFFSLSHVCVTVSLALQ